MGYGPYFAGIHGNALVNSGNTLLVPSISTTAGDPMPLFDNQSGIVEDGTIDALDLVNTGTLEATTVRTSDLLAIPSGTITDLSGTWIARNGSFTLPAGDKLAGIAGSVTLDGAGSGFGALSNSYQALETILAGGTLAVLNGATFGIDPTPGATIVAGGTTFYGGTLMTFGNAGLL